MPFDDLPFRTRFRGPAFFIAAALCFAALAIVRPAEVGSVRVSPVRVGIDECDACGMKIEDSGFAGARIVMRDGRRATLFYDDLGCMLDAAREHGAARKTFVQDATDGKWVRAEEAWYVMDAKNRTPMSSGILASRNLPGPGAMTFQEVARSRRAFMKAKYGGE